LNLNGIYGPPGSTIENGVTGEFESLGVVFVSPPGPSKIIGGPPACSFCGLPPAGGILVSGGPTGFFGAIDMSLLTQATE